MLTSTMFHARAVVCSDPSMCDAIALRMCDIGTISSPPPATTGPGTERNAGAAAAAGADARQAPRVPPAADGVHHVLLRDPPTGPGPRDLRQIELVLLGELPHERREDLRPRPAIGQRRTRAGAAAAGGASSPEGLAAEADPGAAAPTASAATGSCAAAE